MSYGVSSKYGFATLDEKISINDNKQVVYEHPETIEDVRSSYCWFSSLFRLGMRYIDVFIVGVWLTDDYMPIFYQNIGDARVLSIVNNDTLLVLNGDTKQRLHMMPDAPRAVIFGHNIAGTSDWRFW
jgi:hypothetical protein